MQYVSRLVRWLSAFAWGLAVALVAGQAAHDIPAPIGIAALIVAATLTLVACQIGRREAPAKVYEPAPLRVIRPCDEETVGISTRTRATVPLYSIAPVGQTYRSRPQPTPSEMPRPRASLESAITTGGHRRRAKGYGDAFSDIMETLTEPRDDDPDPVD